MVVAEKQNAQQHADRDDHEKPDRKYWQFLRAVFLGDSYIRWHIIDKIASS